MPERGVAASSCAISRPRSVMHAAHPAHPRFHALPRPSQRRHLAALDLVERGLQAEHDVVDTLDLGELVRLHSGDHGRARFQPRFAVGRRHEDHGVADRRRFRRSRCAASLVAAPRAGGRIEPVTPSVGNGAERGGARFQRGLAAHDLVELLVELFLIEQLAAGGAVDLGAQFGDAIFIGVLHLRLTGDQAGQHVVAKGEIGRRCRRPHAEHDRPCRPRSRTLPGRSGPACRHGPGCSRLCLRGGATAVRLDGRAARGSPAMVVRVVLGILGIMDRNGTTSALPRRPEMSSVRLQLARVI